MVHLRKLPSAERSAAVIPHPVFDDTRREGTDPAVTGTRRPASLRSHQLWVWEGLGQGRHEADSFVFGKHQAQGVAGQICLCLGSVGPWASRGRFACVREVSGPGRRGADLLVFGKCRAMGVAGQIRLCLEVSGPWCHEGDVCIWEVSDQDPAARPDVVRPGQFSSSPSIGGRLEEEKACSTAFDYLGRRVRL